ncbi:MAG: tetratricopeptide repeat protein [Candidatus Omnitrophica bacterium]|nr:tetratricopeptide repeat protein [Candidatus Omnitrophota bacterium]
MRRKLLLIFLVVFVLTTSQAHAYWIWTPKSKKWINPKSSVKPTPKEQFAFSRDFFELKSYDEAEKEFKKLLKAYPKSFEASESQFYLGRIAEETGRPYEAYLAYQKVIDKYPFSERIKEINEREYKIGELFMSGEKRKAMGLTLPVENPSIEIFTRVIENSTYGPLAPKAQYKLGLVLKELKRYFEAEDAFNKVISNYPDSEWSEPSKFQIAVCRQAVSRGADYDQGATEEAKQKFEEFVKEHPEAILSDKAEKSISAIREEEAEANFNIGRFYEKQKQFESAKIYYNEVITNYSDSTFAAKAQEKLRTLEKKK